MTQKIFSVLFILLLSQPVLAAQSDTDADGVTPAQQPAQLAAVQLQSDGAPMFGPDMRFDNSVWVFGLSGGLASQIAHLSSSDVAQDPDDGTHANLNILVGVDVYDFVQLLTTFELSLDNQQKGYDWVTNDYDETIPNYIRAGLRLGVTAVRIGDVHVRAGIDGFYKRISAVKEAAGELCLDPSACEGMGPRRVKHDGFGVGLVVGADYNFSYDRDRPQFSVGVDCRTDYNFFGEPGVQDSYTSSFPSDVGAPSTLDFGCQAGFKFFFEG